MIPSIIYIKNGEQNLLSVSALSFLVLSLVLQFFIQKLIVMIADLTNLAFRPGLLYTAIRFRYMRTTTESAF